MKNNTLKERLKAIYHIIFDKEYIVFTVTMKNQKIKSICALTSDNASDIFIETAIEVLKINIKRK